MVRMRLMQRVSDMLDSGLGSRHMHIYHGCCTSCPPARVTEQVTKIAGPELWFPPSATQRMGHPFFVRLPRKADSSG